MKKLSKVSARDILDELEKKKSMASTKYKVCYDGFEGENEYVIALDEWRRAQTQKRYW